MIALIRLFSPQSSRFISQLKKKKKERKRKKKLIGKFYMMKRMKRREKKNVSPLPFYIIQLFPSRNFLNKDQHNLCNHVKTFFFFFFLFFLLHRRKTNIVSQNIQQFRRSYGYCRFDSVPRFESSLHFERQRDFLELRFGLYCFENLECFRLDEERKKKRKKKKKEKKIVWRESIYIRANTTYFARIGIFSRIFYYRINSFNL